MRKFCAAALAVLLLPAAAVLAGPGHGGGSHGGGSHGGGSHGGGSHGGCGSHGGGTHHGGGGRGPVIVDGPYEGGWGVYGIPYGSDYGSGYAEDPYDWATVDIEVSPVEARVYLEGRYIGTAWDFGGKPDYLYLRPGAYKLEFRLEGYEPLPMKVDAESGAKIEVHERLHRIPGATQYGFDEAPLPEGGVQRYWGKRRGTLQAYDARQPRNERGPNDIEAEVDRDEAPASQPAPMAKVSQQRARLLFSVQPADTVVYLDGHFIGTAEELSAARSGVPLTPGKHTIALLRPGFKARELEIDVAPGELKRVDIRLEE